MSGFRDKFVLNTENDGRLDTPDTELFVFHDSYPNNSQIHEYPHSNSIQPSSPKYRQKRPAFIHMSHSYKNHDLPLTPTTKHAQNHAENSFPHDEYHEQHEMLDLPRNPFRDPRQNEATDDETDNPFNDTLQTRLAPENYDFYPENTVSSEPEMSESEKSHRRLIRHQERNRRKLETRLPWYHYTRLPWFTILVTVIQVVVFIIELIRMTILTGSAFQTKPYFNPMLGPLTYLLISMGARYVPCMHKIDDITSDMLLQWPCPNSTSTDTDVCNLAELCSLTGIPIKQGVYAPDQWYRLITPIFLHAGFLHILFNLLLQLTMGWSVEKAIGWIKYSTIYLASGVAGFLLGANFSPNGILSTGASGALFGILATNFLLFIYCGKENTNIYKTKHYKLFILVMVLEVLVSFVLGLLPGLDNFSHIGGFCVGLLLAITFLKDPSFVYNEGIYIYDPLASTMDLFKQNWNPMNNWDHKIRWKVLAWAGLRATCLILAVVYFSLLFVNLYSMRMQSDEEVCSWCKYLSCLPVNGWCDEGELTVTTLLSSSATATATSSLASATSTLPTSIENPNARRKFNRRFQRKYDFSVFSQSHRGSLGSEQMDTATCIIAVLAVCSVFVVTFLQFRKRRKT